MRWGLVGIVAAAMLAPQLALAGTPRLQLNKYNFNTGESVTLTVTGADANADVIVVSSDASGSYSNPEMTLDRTDASGRWTSPGYPITRDFRSSCDYETYVMVNGKQSNKESYCVTRTTENPSGVHGYVVETQNSFQYIETTVEIDGTKRVSTSGGFYETRDLEPGRHTITVQTPHFTTEQRATNPEYNICSGGADCGRNSGGWSSGDTASFNVTEGNIATVYFRFLVTNHNGIPTPPGGTEPEPCNATHGSCSAGQINTYRCRNAVNYQKCERKDANNDGFAIYCWNAPNQCPANASICTGSAGNSITDDPNNPHDIPVCTNALQGPTPSTIYSVGGQVEVTENGVNVRSAPAGGIAGTRNAGAQGTIAASPAIPARLDGVWHQWWKVNFSNLTGWVTEGFLRPAGSSAGNYVDAGNNVSGTFPSGASKLYSYLNASVYVNGAKRDDIQNNGFVMWRVTSKDGAACGADNCGVVFEPIPNGNQAQDPTAVFSSKGSYQLQFCAPFILPCDTITADIRQGGTIDCDQDVQQRYLARWCPPGFNPTRVSWGTSGAFPSNPSGPYHACNIRNLPVGGINAGGCSGKYSWPNGGDDTTARTPSTPTFNDGADAYGYAHIVAEAWNSNWTRALNLNGIPTRSGQWNIAARYMAHGVRQDGPYKWLGIPPAYADFFPESHASTYVSPEALASGPGQLPLCMQDYSVNAQVYGYAKGWWGLPSGMNPDGARPGRRIPQTGKCVPDWRHWRANINPIPQYTGGPGPSAVSGNCGGPTSTADEVVCGSAEDQFYCTANKTRAAIGEAVTFTAFGATPLEWNANIGATPRQQSAGQSFTTTWNSVSGSMNQTVSFTHRTDGSVQSESCSVLLYDPNPAPPPPPPAPVGPLNCSGGDASAGTVAGTVTLRAFDVTGGSSMSFGVYPVRNGVRQYELAKWPGGVRVGASNTFRGTLTAAQLSDGNFGNGRYGVNIWLWGRPDDATDDRRCATYDFVKSGDTITIPTPDLPPPPPPAVTPPPPPVAPPPPAGPLPPPSCTLTPTPGGTSKAINTRFGVTWAATNADYISVAGPGWSGTIDCGLHDDNGDGIGDRFDPVYATPYSCRAAFLRTASGGGYDLGTQGTWGNLYMREAGSANVTATPKRYDGASGAPCALTITTSGGGPTPPPPPPPPAPTAPRCRLNGTLGNSSVTKTVGDRFEVPWAWENADYITVSTPWAGTVDCGKRADGTFDPNYFPYPYKCFRDFMSSPTPYDLRSTGQWGNLYMREAGTARVTITPKRNDGTTGASCTLTITGTGTLVAPPPPPVAPPPPPAAAQAPTYYNHECSVTSVTQLGGGRVKLRVVGGTALPDSVGFWNLSRGVGTATWVGRGVWTTINSTTYDVTLSAVDHANTYGRYQASFWKWGTSDATNILCSEAQFDIPRPTAATSGSDVSALADTLQGLRSMLLGLQSALGQ
ncbi:MAG: hypothetical protein EXS68_00055 [Candidatus Ryanbacteria bacterium]|nr:hypothetical protein [Candidatus Ryanbacteria bacterium]